MTTMREVAERAGVSIGTVSRLINSSGYVSAVAAKRIRHAISVTGYVPSSAARTLKTRKSGLIALVTGDLLNPFVAQLAQSAAIRLADLGWHLLTAVTDDDEQRVSDLLASLRGQSVDGVILTPPETPTLRNHALEIAKSGTPVVSFGLDLDDIGDVVTADTYGGARLGVRHLIENGHTKIAIAGHVSPADNAHGRLNGWRDELKSHGIRPLQRRIVTIPRGAERQETVRHLCDDVTAVFTVNDLVAVDLLHTALSLGIAVPDELSVVGFDDGFLAETANPGLTTVAQPTREMGIRLAESVVRRILDPDLQPAVLRLPCRLIVRDSVSPIGQPPSRAPAGSLPAAGRI